MDMALWSENGDNLGFRVFESTCMLNPPKSRQACETCPNGRRFTLHVGLSKFWGKLDLGEFRRTWG